MDWIRREHENAAFHKLPNIGESIDFVILRDDVEIEVTGHMNERHQFIEYQNFEVELKGDSICHNIYDVSAWRNSED